MYQRIEADGYNNYQSPPGGLDLYQPYDQPEPYYDAFKMASLKVEYNFGPATLTSATSYWKRDVVQSTDSTEALQNINNLTHLVNGAYVPNFIQNLYSEEDPTTQFAEELRLTSNDSGKLEMGRRAVLRQARLGIHHAQSGAWIRDRIDLRLRKLSRGRLLPCQRCGPRQQRLEIPRSFVAALTPARRPPTPTEWYSTTIIRTC